MKRLLLFSLVAVLTLAGGAAFAQDTTRIIEPPLVPMAPEVMAQGGSFVANAHGYNALFYNPAGFAEPRGSLTLASSTAWVYARPDRVFDIVGSLSGGSQATDFVGELEEQITGGGVGVGFAGGFGLVGRNLGLGVVAMVDSYLHGAPFPLGTEGYAIGTVAAIGGMAIPLQLLGLDVTVGADIRPMWRLHAPLDSTVALDLVGALTGGGDPLAALDAAAAYVGIGVGVDLGTMVQLGPIRAALAIRDFAGTRFSYSQATVGDFTGSGSGEPTEIGEDMVFVIPMNVSAGIAIDPNLGALNVLIDPVVHVDLQDVVGVIRDKRSPWTLLHAGVEARILSFFKLRAGFNQGYITMGGGVKLLFLDVNAALFTRELGKRIGDQPNSGASLEVALRF